MMLLEIKINFKNEKVIKSTKEDILNIGKTVKVKFLEHKNEKVFHLVGSIEADPRANKISIESPLGKAMLNHSEGDKVEVKTETGRLIQIEILEIE